MCAFLFVYCPMTVREVIVGEVVRGWFDSPQGPSDQQCVSLLCTRHPALIIAVIVDVWISPGRPVVSSCKCHACSAYLGAVLWLNDYLDAREP